MTDDNPFAVNAYMGPSFFCDREEETRTIASALRNGRHVMLYSPRRYGKTGLIHHVFHGLSKVRGARTVFADIYAARDVHEFNTILLNAVHQALNPTPKQFLKNVMAWFSALRPVVSMDELTGSPSISLERSSHRQEAATTREIFRVLNEQDRTIFLAIDEFQQIATFQEARMDALLRTELQRSTKVRCIFSGSQRHILLDLFNNAANPFYGSADQVELKRIDRATYADFAPHLMKRHGRSLKKEEALFCYDLCRGHTYYMQVLLNRLFGDSATLDRDTVVRSLLAIVREQDAIMATLRSALTRNQWDLFAAISREGEVDTPTGAAFTRKYNLPSSAALVHALQALLDRELIYITEHAAESGKPVYAPYNPFMAAWFKYR
ncbi:MAG: ATP-binding protein [Flavobacteriales bacterium]|nr:ATP-binding protein [Flavobacteriales bacterium]MBP9078694.1 ATP-binding protein [Flavobacteriales bacterium]